MKRKILTNKLIVLSMTVIVLLVLCAVLAPQLAPNDPYKQSLADKLLAPCRQYPFGTDDLGRCILSRILYGCRTSLATGVLTTAISAAIGVLLGLIAGFNGGMTDELIMRVVDMFMAFPSLIMALTVAGILDGGVVSVIIALSLVSWMNFARIVRARVLSEKEAEYIKAALVCGASRWRIYFRHLFPAVLPSVIVLVSLGVGNNILASASLSFLGVGVSPPTAEWGAMLNEGKGYIQRSVYPTLFPGLAIMFSALAFKLLGDGLQDVLDPKRKNAIKPRRRRELLLRPQKPTYEIRRKEDVQDDRFSRIH